MPRGLSKPSQSQSIKGHINSISSTPIPPSPGESEPITILLTDEHTTPSSTTSSTPSSQPHRRIPSPLRWFQTQTTQTISDPSVTGRQVPSLSRDGSPKSGRFSSLFRSASPSSRTEQLPSPRTPSRTRFGFGKRNGTNIQTEGTSTTPTNSSTTTAPEHVPQSSKAVSPSLMSSFTTQSTSSSQIVKTPELTPLDGQELADVSLSTLSESRVIERLESLTLDIDNRRSTFTRDEASASRARRSPAHRHRFFAVDHFSPQHSLLDSLTNGVAMTEEDNEETPTARNSRNATASSGIAPDLFVRRLEKKDSNCEWNDDDSELIAAASKRHRLQEMAV